MDEHSLNLRLLKIHSRGPFTFIILKSLHQNISNKGAVERAAKRAHKGPPLITQRAIKAKNNRQMKLKRQFNKEAAEWTAVRKKAKMAYFIQNNSEREAILESLGFDLIEATMKNDRLREASAQKLAEVSNFKSLNERFSSNLNINLQVTGNGN